jgi:hypothetical protein
MGWRVGIVSARYTHHHHHFHHPHHTHHPLRYNTTSILAFAAHLATTTITTYQYLSSITKSSPHSPVVSARSLGACVATLSAQIRGNRGHPSAHSRKVCEARGHHDGSLWIGHIRLGDCLRVSLTLLMSLFMFLALCFPFCLHLSLCFCPFLTLTTYFGKKEGL